MYSIRFRSDDVPGYKGMAFLWPVNKVSGDIEYPEANLNEDLVGIIHTAVWGSAKQTFRSTATWSSWHTATLEWTPTSVTFLLDGKSLGTTTKDVPQTPMTLAVRAECDEQGAPKPPASAQGDMQIDWLTVYSYVPPSGS
jgi:beta-glucanase (GH16 family)